MPRRQVAITSRGTQYGAEYREKGWFFWGSWKSLIIGFSVDKHGFYRSACYGTLEEAKLACSRALRNGGVPYDYSTLLPIDSIHDE